MSSQKNITLDEAVKIARRSPGFLITVSYYVNKNQIRHVPYIRGFKPPDIFDSLKHFEQLIFKKLENKEGIEIDQKKDSSPSGPATTV